MAIVLFTCLLASCFKSTPIEPNSLKGLFFGETNDYLHSSIYVVFVEDTAYMKSFFISKGVVFSRLSDTLYYDKKKGIYTNKKTTIYQKNTALYCKRIDKESGLLNVKETKIEYFPTKETELATLINTSPHFTLMNKTFKDLPEEIINNFDKMGIDSSDILNSYESKYLNEIFGFYRKDFDFTNKKIGFIHRGVKSNKNEYFGIDKHFLIHNPSLLNNGELYILDNKQKQESGGYDAVILYWCKMYRSIEEIIKKIKIEDNL